MILYICALDDYGFQGYATQENCTKVLIYTQLN